MKNINLKCIFFLLLILLNMQSWAQDQKIQYLPGQKEYIQIKRAIELFEKINISPDDPIDFSDLNDKMILGDDLRQNRKNLEIVENSLITKSENLVRYRKLKKLLTNDGSNSRMLNLVAFKCWVNFYLNLKSSYYSSDCDNSSYKNSSWCYWFDLFISGLDLKKKSLLPQNSEKGKCPDHLSKLRFEWWKFLGESDYQDSDRVDEERSESGEEKNKDKYGKSGDRPGKPTDGDDDPRRIRPQPNNDREEMGNTMNLLNVGDIDASNNDSTKFSKLQLQIRKEYKNKFNLLEKIQNEVENLVQKLDSKIDRLERRTRDYDEMLPVISLQYNYALEDEVETLNAAYSQLLSQKVAINKDIESKSSFLVPLRDSLKTYRDSLNYYKNMIVKNTNEVKIKEKKIKKLTKDNVELQRRIKILETKCLVDFKCNQKEIDEMKQKKDKFNQNLFDIADLQKDIRELRESSNFSNSRIPLIVQTIDSLSPKLKALNEKFEKENKELIERYGFIEQEIEVVLNLLERNKKSQKKLIQ